MNKFHRLSLCLCAALVVALGLAPCALAATLYVDAANSSGIEDGTFTYPFDTIQEAMDAALEDDTVSVARGIYYGQLQLNRGIQLISQEGPQVTILDGLSSYAINGYYVNTIHNYYIKGFTLTGSGGLVSLIRTAHVVMENCIFRDAPHGLYLSLGSGFTARNCQISNIAGIAVHSMFNYPPLFQNVTVDGAATGFRSIASSVRPYNVTISNVGTALDPSQFYGGYFNGSNVNIWNTQIVATNPANVNIANQLTVDPLFVAPPNDYRLQAGSPLIDAGIDVGLPFVGTAPDIGAYEFAELTLPEQVENLASSFAGAPSEIFRDPADQRKMAIYKKFEAVLRMVYVPETASTNDSRLNVLNGCLAKLKNDILGKVDGSSGGNPGNDWIEDGPEKIALYDQVLTVIAHIEQELAEQP